MANSIGDRRRIVTGVAINISTAKTASRARNFDKVIHATAHAKADITIKVARISKEIPACAASIRLIANTVVKRPIWPSNLFNPTSASNGTRTVHSKFNC